MKTNILFACILVVVSFGNAAPVEPELSTVEQGTKDTTQTTLLDLDQTAERLANGDELKRTARGLGLGGFGKGFGGGFGGLSGKFGGFGGHGLGGFGHGFGGHGGGHGGSFKKLF